MRGCLCLTVAGMRTAAVYFDRTVVTGEIQHPPIIDRRLLHDQGDAERARYVYGKPSTGDGVSITTFFGVGTSLVVEQSGFENR